MFRTFNIVYKRNGAKIIEVNIENSFRDSDIIIEDKAVTALPELERHVRKLVNPG